MVNFIIKESKYLFHIKFSRVIFNFYELWCDGRYRRCSSVPCPIPGSTAFSAVADAEQLQQPQHQLSWELSRRKGKPATTLHLGFRHGRWRFMF